MRYRQLLASAVLTLTLVSHAEAQTQSEVIVAPFVVEAGDDDKLRAQSQTCFARFSAALTSKGVKVARAQQLLEKNLQSVPASWAVLGRISREKELFQVELRLLDVKTGDELRSYFNSDKDLQVACRVVEKAAERIALFVAEQRSQ